jgi:tetratricopeptide (TPR) repeat protein
LEGNEHFKKGHYRKATKSYNQALSQFNAMYDLTEEEEEEVNNAKLPLYLNLAASCLKLGEITKAITNAEKVRLFIA